jgi:hypothetical protein
MLYSSYTNDDGWYLFKENRSKTKLPLGILYQCPSGKGKEKGTSCVKRGKCLEIDGHAAMEGPFCGVCRKGYAKGDADELCRKCRSVGVSLFLVFTDQMVVFIVSLGLSLGQYLKNPKATPHGSAVVLRQFVNYVQLTTVVFPVTRLSSVGDAIIEASAILQYCFASRPPKASSVAAHCLVAWIAPSMESYKVWIVAGFFFTPAWILFDIAFYLFVKCLCTMCRLPWKPQMTHLITGITANLFIVQPRLTQVFLLPFQCTFLDASRLRLQTDILCKSSDINKWQSIAMLGLFCVSFGIPMCLVLFLRRYKSQGKLFSEECVKMFGFVFQGLRPEYYYFECINMVRKVIYQAASSVPWFVPSNQDEELRNAMISMSMVIVTIVFLALDLRCKPYDNRNYSIFAKIESSMLWAIFISCLGQVWHQQTEETWVIQASPNRAKYRHFRDFLVTTIVILFHVRFFAFMLWGLFGRMFRSHHWCAVKLLGGTDEVQILHGGFEFTGLNSRAQKNMAETIRDTTMQQFRDGHFEFEEIEAAMQRVCVQALYQRKRDEFADENLITGLLLGLKKVTPLPEKLSGWLYERVCRSVKTSDTEGAIELKRKWNGFGIHFIHATEKISNSQRGKCSRSRICTWRP